VVILDGGQLAQTAMGLVVPSNITLLALPPYSPELNPVERVLALSGAAHWLAKLGIFAAWRTSWDACEMAWNRFRPPTTA